MEYGNISPEAITAIARETAKILREELLPDLELERTIKRLWGRQHLSPKSIAKYGLIPGVNSPHAVRAILHRGEFGKENQGWFKDVRGNYRIMVGQLKQYVNYE